MELPSGKCEWPVEYDEFIAPDLADGTAGPWAHAYCGSRAGGAQGMMTPTTRRAAVVAGLIVATA